MYTKAKLMSQTDKAQQSMCGYIPVYCCKKPVESLEGGLEVSTVLVARRKVIARKMVRRSQGHDAAGSGISWVVSGDESPVPQGLPFEQLCGSTFSFGFRETLKTFLTAGYPSCISIGSTRYAPKSRRLCS